MNSDLQPPILYSFRRCPYAMRARVALAKAEISVEMREILLRSKPAEMLACSPKGTVPVLLLESGDILDESLDVMHWALENHDPDGWLEADPALTQALIAQNDGEFKYFLDRYKYHDRFPEKPKEDWRAGGELFLQRLESQLQQNGGHGLLADRWTLADIAILPFIRQFRGADSVWFDQANYPALQQWLDRFLNAKDFLRIMKKYPCWESGQAPLLENWHLPN